MAYYLKKINKTKAGQVAQCLKLLAAKPGNLSWITLDPEGCKRTDSHVL